MEARDRRVGLVGAGFQARNLAEAVTQTPGLRVVAVTSMHAQSAKELASRFQARSERDVASLLRDEDIDLIVIATPNKTHAELVLQSLDAGKTVFVEKPLGLSHAELDAIASRLADTPQRLVVGHALRTAPGIRRLIEAVENGDIGTVLSIDVRRTRVLRPSESGKGWKQDPRQSGGELLHEIHELDIACLVGGRPTEVWSASSRLLGAGAEPPFRHSLIKFENGAVAHHVIASGDHAATWSVTVSGTHASLHADLRAATVTRLEAGSPTARWPVFDDTQVNESLAHAATGPASHNSPGRGASPWMASLAVHEMAEVARILDGAQDSILLRDPAGAVRLANELIDAERGSRRVSVALHPDGETRAPDHVLRIGPRPDNCTR